MSKARKPLKDMGEVSLTFFFADNDEDTVARALLELRKTAPERWRFVWSIFEKTASHKSVVARVTMKIKDSEK